MSIRSSAMRATVLLLAGGWTLATATAVANETAANSAPLVYRCKQANGVVLYADYPCGAGVVVDIKPDSADPRAIERLQRAAEEFDRGAAMRRQAEEMATLRAEAAYDRRFAAEAPPDSADSQASVSYATDYGWYVPYAIPRQKRFDERPHPEPHRAVAKHHVPAVIRRPTPG